MLTLAFIIVESFIKDYKYERSVYIETKLWLVSSHAPIPCFKSILMN